MNKKIFAEYAKEKSGQVGGGSSGSSKFK